MQKFPCVDGLELSAEQIEATYSDRLQSPVFPFRLSVGEIGVFMTYRAVWKKILDDNIDAALVVEDDVDIDRAEFQQAFELALSNISWAGLIRFGLRKPRFPYKVIKAKGRTRLIYEMVAQLGMQCQVFSREAAQRLLLTSGQFDRPVDCHLQLFKVTQQRVFMVSPSGVSEKSDLLGGSTIHERNDKGILALLDRELTRTIFRMKIRHLSRSWYKQGPCDLM